MEVFLLTDVEKLGTIGDVVNVKDGFARNYLVPRQMAVPCTKSNLKIVEEKKRLIVLRTQRERDKFSQLAERIGGISCTIRVQAGEEDKLYGSVTNADIQQALMAEGIEIDKRKINLEEPIKELGIYTIEIELHPEVKALLKVWIVKE